MSQPHTKPFHIARIIAPLVILTMGIGAVFIILSYYQEQKTQRPTPKPPMVTTVAPVESKDGLVFKVDGVVVPYREIMLSAEVSGKVTMKKSDEDGEPLQEGSYITAGTELLEIDSKKYNIEEQRLGIEKQQAINNHKEVTEEIELTQVSLKNAIKNLEIQTLQYERYKTLALNNTVTESQRDQEHQAKLVAEDQTNQLSSQEKSLKLKLSSYDQAIQLIEAKLEQARIDQANTKIISPINGVIIKDYVEEDSYVQVGTALYEIEDTKAVEVRCNLRMNELAWIWKMRTQSTDPKIHVNDDYRLPTTPVTVVYNLAGHNYKWEGQLSRFDGIGLDEKTRTAPVLVRVPEPTHVTRDGTSLVSDGPSALLRGMYVQLQVKVKTETKIWKIPDRALQPGDFVWMAVEGNLARKKVQVIHRQGNEVLIDGTVTPFLESDKIIISPLSVSIVGLPLREALDADQEIELSPSDINPLRESKEGDR